MKRWMLIGILCIGLIAGSTLVGPPDAGAWLTDAPLEAVIEGDPESPDFASPGGQVLVDSDEQASITPDETELSIQLILNIFLEVLLP